MVNQRVWLPSKKILLNYMITIDKNFYLFKLFRIIYHSLEPRKLIIFEDLCEAGYNTVRERYLNEEELKLVYRKIAKFHAVSYMLGLSEDHECVTTYNDGIFADSLIMSMDLMSKGIVHFIDLLGKHKEFNIYLEKVKAMQPEINNNCKDLYRAYKMNAGRDHIFVLNHGDFHMKNLMFKMNDNQQAEDLIMVDYQISCFGPSTIDLTYSQYMLMSPELRLRRNEFMQYYFSEFLRMLKRINYQGALPRYSEFQIAGLKYRHFCKLCYKSFIIFRHFLNSYYFVYISLALFLLSTFLPMMNAMAATSMEELKDLDMAKYVENPDASIEIYENVRYVRELHQLLPSLLIDGYLD